MIVEFSRWLHATSLGHAVAGGVFWLWPTAEVLHFIGMALLIGIVGLLDLRILGLAKGLPIGPLERLIPWGILGFVMNVVTGVMFFAGEPFQYIGNWVFWAKMAFIAVAGVNVGLFYVTGLARKVDAVGPGGDAPMPAKLIAATSLFLWLGVMYFGRMLPFLGVAF